MTAAMAKPAGMNEESVADWYATAAPLCVARLREAHNPQTGLFSRQLRDGAWGATGDKEATTSTAICLITLSRAGIDLRELGAKADQSLQALNQLVQSNPGATGLAIWANAVNGGRGYHALLGPSRDVRHLLPTLTTMESAWLLSGLLHAQRAEASDELTAAIDQTLYELLGRQSRHGLFAHSGNAARPGDLLRRQVANFADQIYPQQALAFAAIALGSSKAFDAARRCANALLARRGPLGQWWWHYNPDRGSVSRNYPVYSVHQHGMAPMAFMALSAAGARDCRDLVWPGLEWLHDNELGVRMLDPAGGTIWRDIDADEGSLSKRLRDVCELLGTGSGREASKRLRLNLETRPYEWGWCLMAGAMLTTPAQGMHLA
jgi:hypothetical protein